MTGQPPKRSTSLHYEPTIGSGRPSRQATQSVTDIMGNSNASSSRLILKLVFKKYLTSKDIFFS